MHIKSPYPPLPDVEPENVHDFCFRRRATDPEDYTFTIYDGRERSFRTFRDRVQYAITAFGVPKSQGGLGLSREAGEMVGILGPTVPDYSVIFLALLASTVPAVPLSSYSTPHELRFLIQRSNITRLFVHPEYFDLASQVARDVGLPNEHIYIFEGEVSNRLSLSQMIENVAVQQTPLLKARPVERDTIAYLMFSSGTTGLPKAVVISHYNICYNLRQAEEVRKWTAPVPPVPFQRPVILTYLPLHHTFGLQFAALRSMLVPTTLVYLPHWEPVKALDLIERHRVMSLNLVPSLIRSFIDAQKTRQADISSIIHFGAGAAYLPPELQGALEKIKKTNVSVTQGYGMSEAVITIASIPPTSWFMGKPYKVARGSVGLLQPGMEARILREDGTECGLDEVGEIYIRGGNVGLGYWKDEVATRSTFLEGGWLRTGDRMRVDENGNLFFADRAKETLKVSGMQVSPTEIEDTLLEHPDSLVVDCAVAGVSGGRTEDEKVPRAWIVLTPEAKKRGHEAVVSSLHAWMEERLSKYKQLRGGIEIVDEIPKNPTGKILKRLLVDKYEAGKTTKARL